MEIANEILGIACITFCSIIQYLGLTYLSCSYNIKFTIPDILVGTVFITNTNVILIYWIILLSVPPSLKNLNNQVFYILNYFTYYSVCIYLCLENFRLLNFYIIMISKSA